jgi:hypothetical protein
LLGTRIKRWWFQLVWHPQLFVHLLYFEGMGSAKDIVVLCEYPNVPFIRTQSQTERELSEKRCLWSAAKPRRRVPAQVSRTASLFGTCSNPSLPVSVEKCRIL